MQGSSIVDIWKCIVAEAPPLPVSFIRTMKNGVKLIMQHHCDVWITFITFITHQSLKGPSLSVLCDG